MLSILRMQLKISWYEITNRKTVSVIVFFIFIGILVFSVYQRSELMNRSIGDDIIFETVASYYIIIRMVLSGMTIPYDILAAESKYGSVILKSTVIKSGVPRYILGCLMYRFLRSYLLNYITFLAVVVASGIYYDINNYVALLIPLFVGQLNVFAFGFILALIMILADVRRELVSIAQIGLTIVFVGFINKTYSLLPFSIAKDVVSGILADDLVFAITDYSRVTQRISYWVVSVVATGLIILIIAYISDILLRKNMYWQLKNKSNDSKNTEGTKA